MLDQSLITHSSTRDADGLRVYLNQCKEHQFYVSLLSRVNVFDPFEYKKKEASPHSIPSLDDLGQVERSLIKPDQKTTSSHVYNRETIHPKPKKTPRTIRCLHLYTRDVIDQDILTFTFYFEVARQTEFSFTLHQGKIYGNPIKMGCVFYTPLSYLDLNQWIASTLLEGFMLHLPESLTLVQTLDSEDLKNFSLLEKLKQAQRITWSPSVGSPSQTHSVSQDCFQDTDLILGTDWSGQGLSYYNLKEWIPLEVGNWPFFAYHNHPTTSHQVPTIWILTDDSLMYRFFIEEQIKIHDFYYGYCGCRKGGGGGLCCYEFVSKHSLWKDIVVNPTRCRVLFRGGNYFFRDAHRRLSPLLLLNQIRRPSCDRSMRVQSKWMSYLKGYDQSKPIGPHEHVLLTPDKQEKRKRNG